MTDPSLSTAVIRISRGSFDPSRLAEVDAVNTKTAGYLMPAVQRLPGLLQFYAGVSPEGAMVNVSVWVSGSHAAQMSQLTEMTVDARGEMEAVGVTFAPIVHYPVSWTVGPAQALTQAPLPSSSPFNLG
jgi:hypothetical protein